MELLLRGNTVEKLQNRKSSNFRYQSKISKTKIKLGHLDSQMCQGLNF